MIPCEIVKDIMPIYIEDGCLEASKQLIQEHLKECEGCREYYKKMNTKLVPEEMLVREKSEEDNRKEADEEERNRESSYDEAGKTGKNYSMKKALTKIRNRWIASLVIVVLSIMIIVPNVYLIHNEIKQEGISYSSLDEIFTSRRFLKELKKGNYEKAFEYFDVKSLYEGEAGYTDLEQTVYEENYKKIVVDNEVYYVQNRTYENEYNDYEKNKDTTDFWSSIYYRGNSIIPEEDFNALNVEEGDSHRIYGTVVMEGKRYVVSVENENYFFNGDDNIDRETYVIGLEIGSDEYIHLFGSMDEWSLVPEVIYENRNKEARESIAYAAEIGEKYRALGYSGYYESCKEKFINAMKELESKGVSIVGYNIDYLYESGHRIQYQITLSNGKESFKGQGVDFSITKAGIIIGAGYIKTEVSETQNELYHLLFNALVDWRYID
ncbi:zf-HC2 domain-containing protein [Anaerosporobacter sp.]|uniref:zf-HC2 domain-containing protein n=1 Tax=Anaerosporobacter sp. TaxID=1872529 RepID=UPI00286EED06|nr:zf-HC2 domain-containing protein [Anaerosporobacter sp.]